MEAKDESKVVTKANLAALLSHLEKDSLAYRLVEIAGKADPQARTATVTAALQARVDTLSKAFLSF